MHDSSNLDVPLCFYILHPPTVLENTRIADSLAFPPTLSSSDHSRPKQGHSVQGWVLSENLISEFVTSERGTARRGEKQRQSLKEGSWIDEGDEETVSGKIEDGLKGR